MVITMDCGSDSFLAIGVNLPLKNPEDPLVFLFLAEFL